MNLDTAKIRPHEIVKLYVNSLEKEMREKHKEFHMAGMVGVLQATLIDLIILFEVFMPETFDVVFLRSCIGRFYKELNLEANNESASTI